MIVFTPLLNIFFINLISSWWRGLYKLKKFETSRIFFSSFSRIAIRFLFATIDCAFHSLFSSSLSLFLYLWIFWNLLEEREERNSLFSKTKRKRKKIKNILGIRSHSPTSNFSENYDFSRNWNYIFKIYLLFDIYNVFLLGNERIEFMAKSERKIQKVFQFLVSY